ncbi:MAG: ribosome maturation factor RimM [Steroidobacteraceae bacterium]
MPQQPEPDPAPLTVGQVGSAHGIRGELTVRSFTDPPEAVLDYEPWRLVPPRGEPRTVRIEHAAWHGDRLRIKLEGIDDRNAAEVLRGWWVQVPREQLPPLGEREHYRDDLLGFEVWNLEGERLGKLDYFVDLPTGSVMVISEGAKGSREHWVPAGPPHLKQVDVVAGRLVVDWPSEL